MVESCTGKNSNRFYLENFQKTISYFTFRTVKRPENYVPPPPNVFLQGEEKIKKQSYDMLNMAQVNILKKR
jgi:hypothetical protein